MAFSNSFHSSAKSHSIGSGAALADVEAHNERDFFSLRYSAKKTTLIEGCLGLTSIVQDFLNTTFQPQIDAYNAKQRRKDRKIEETAYEHFCENKKLDIAVQAIFQIGDKDFWDRWRTDEVIQRRGEEIVRHSFPPEVVEVMDAIYRRQIDAYEHIYETHGKDILAKINWHYGRCQDTLDLFRAVPERFERFTALAEMKPKARKAALQELTEAELEAYDEFQAAYHSARDIERKQLRERIAEGQVHIKMLQALGHYDEWSPHAHGVSVCWADGYRNGLQSRVAKAVVLNRYALEVIQERLHDIAQEEIARHPEIFGGEELKEKGAGRNMDYTAEQIIRQKNQALMDENQQLQLECSRLSGQVGLMEVQRATLQDELNDGRAELAALNTQLDEARASIETTLENKAQYDAEIARLRGPGSPMHAFYVAVHKFVKVVKEPTATRRQIIDAAFAMLAPFPPLYRALANLFGYENKNDLPAEERKAPELAQDVNELIAGATTRAGEQPKNAGKELEK